MKFYFVMFLFLFNKFIQIRSINQDRLIEDDLFLNQINSIFRNKLPNHIRLIIKNDNLINLLNSSSVNLISKNSLNNNLLITKLIQNNQINKIEKQLTRIKRSNSKSNGVRSCYCKMKSSFPATINEEKLDFVCNCRRSSHYESFLFKQHKHNSDEDNYLPNSSMRQSSRSKYSTSRQRGRDFKNRFEYERRKRKRKQRKPFQNNQSNNLSDNNKLLNDNSLNDESTSEPNPNETILNEQSNDMCTCNSEDGCSGSTCDYLNGCVCNNRNQCWGISCKSRLNSLDLFSPQINLHQSMKSSSQELLELIYQANKHKLNRNRKFKNFKDLKDEINWPQESSIMSRINLDLPYLHYPYNSINPYHSLHSINPIHPIGHSINPFHHSIQLKSQNFPLPSQLTVKSMILNELVNSKSIQNGQCSCSNDKCVGLECNHLKGCICDEMNCYGKFCKLFKNQYNDAEFPIGNRIPIEYSSHKKRPDYAYENSHMQEQPEYESNSKLSNAKLKYQINDRPDDEIKKQTHYAKESSKTVKCEKIINESSNQINSQIDNQITKKENKNQSNKNNIDLKENDKDDKSLNAYEMKIVKLTPISSSSQYIEQDSLSQSKNNLQHLIKSETVDPTDNIIVIRS